MNSDKRMSGDKRRQYIVDYLKGADQPQKGGNLAEKFAVSRQIIVQDISLLKAGNHPILATPQGYIYNLPPEAEGKVTRKIACRHTGEKMEEELLILVDHGVLVKDVNVEHPVYGEISGQLMIKSRKDVERFCQSMIDEKASLLAELTGGLHLHTLEAEDKVALDEAEEGLRKAGILVEVE